MTQHDKRYKEYEKIHRDAIKAIRSLDSRINELSPFQLAKLEYEYTRAERAAWNIASWNRKNQKYHEGMAEIAQGQEYKEVRKNGGTGVDAQYESRISKGIQLTKAAEYEGDYISWRGVAETYERAANSIKDMIRAHELEGGNRG